MKPQEEAWLSGPAAGIEPVLMPAAHALIQTSRDIEKALSGVSNEELWMKFSGTSSIGFHLLHIAGSIDRLLTYAKGESLSPEHFSELLAETKAGKSYDIKILKQKTIETIEYALDFIKQTPVDILFEKRFVGRKKLPTNVFGLLFHIAEHTQRHTGQIITISNIVKNKVL